MSRYIDKNNAFKRSQNAHANLIIICQERKDIPTSDYHNVVFYKQLDQKRILTKKERKKIYDNQLRKHGIIK